MGWSYGIDGNGREMGYSVVAQCEHPKCRKIIDRGLAYRCGPLGSETGSEPGCGRFFCGEHLFFAVAVSAAPGGGFCEECLLGLDEPDEDSIVCPVCEMRSYHPKDIEHGYCGNCHEYTSPGRVNADR